MTSFYLPYDPSSAGVARETLRSSLDEWGTPEGVGDVMLLVTELIANAVIHGKPEIRMDVDLADSLLVVRVTDGSPVMPRVPGAGGPGRGLGIVETLSDRWGVDPLPEGRDGKTVWFEKSG